MEMNFETTLDSGTECQQFGSQQTTYTYIQY